MLGNLIVTPRERHRFDSDMDLLRLRVEQAAAGAGGPLRTLALLGMGRRAGASTVTLGLARSFAAAGHPVAVVDGNSEAPRISRRLGARRRGGEADAEATGKAVLATVNGSPLVVPSSVDVWREVWQALHTDGGLVLVDAGTADSPPGLAAAAAADGALLVIGAGRTRRQAIVATLDRLGGHSVRLFGVVINRRRYVIPEWLYRRL